MSSRQAFTLIELLVVIAIIALLMSLSIVAVHGIFSSVENSRQQTEINNLANAVEMFKSHYGEYPPSSIELYNRTTASAGYENTPSAHYLRRIFPNIRLTTGSHNWIVGGPSGQVTLTGFECLVLFLGGPNLDGWGKDKANPTNLSGPKDTPYYRFDLNRIQRPRQIPVFNDRSGTPYAYFSRSLTSAYVAGDCSGSGGLPTAQFYRQANNQPQKPDSFQIISAGRDRRFGNGGVVPGSLSRQDMDNFTNFSSGELKAFR